MISLTRTKSNGKFDLTRLLTGIGIVLILLVWLIPTVGLLVTSFRPVALINTTGWWTALDVNNGPESAQHPDPNASYVEKLGTRFTINNYVDA
ncbi:MAG TPA: hypothetical protein PKI51_05810, partial [Anaerolineaceae bacterium]|nr:hypothetical protein [Anaerolineaceae bacterium]